METSCFILNKLLERENYPTIEKKTFYTVVKKLFVLYSSYNSEDYTLN